MGREAAAVLFKLIVKKTSFLIKLFTHRQHRYQKRMSLVGRIERRKYLPLP